MPLYEYECKQCHKHTEKIQKFSDVEITQCPHCGGKLERVVSAAAISFKGGGWFADGYGNAKPKASSGEGESKGKSDSDTKSDSNSSSTSSTEASSSSSKESAPAATPSAPSTAPATSAPSTPSSDNK